MNQGDNLTGKTLIVLSPAFPGNETGEQSPWLPAKQSLIRSLNRNFPELEIIILVFQFPINKTEYTWNGNRVIPFGGANKRRGHNLVLWYKVFRALMRLRKQKKIVGIISFWCAECCLVASYFSRLYNMKHLCWISGLDATKENKFVKRIRPKAMELVAMSDFLTDEFYNNHGIRPEFLIPDAIDTTLFNDETPERTIDILGAGNLVAIKRYDIFIQVVGAIAAKHGHTTTVLCGSGTEEEKIKEQVSLAGLDSMVSLTGLIPQKEVLKLMKKAKIFLHTSIFEGFGNVCIEALYAGAHVISFTRPMKADIPHWHIVTTKEEMIAKALDLLQDDQTPYTPMLPFDMNDSAKKFIEILTLPAGQHE
jgi:glycosyltransferase involved in cell wall biosynthesis